MLCAFQHRFARYLALFAMVVFALMPTIGMVRAAALGISWVELCSGNQIKRIAVDAEGNKLADESAPKHGAIHLGEHCDFCQPPPQLAPGNTDSFTLPLPTGSSYSRPPKRQVALKPSWGATPLSRAPPTQLA